MFVNFLSTILPCPSIDPKCIWTGPSCFGLVQIILDMFNRFGQVQKWHFLVCTHFFERVQNDYDRSKTIWICPKLLWIDKRTRKVTLSPKINCPPLTWVSNAIDRTGFKPISYRFKHTWCLTHVSWCVSYSHLDLSRYSQGYIPSYMTLGIL